MSGSSLDDQLAPLLAERRRQGLYRSPRVMSRRGGARVALDGRVCTAFCSNDYLGLADHPAIAAAAARSAERGVGSSAAHLITGHGPEHAALEEALADFVGRSRALLFSTGYMANMGVINALCGPGDMVFEDRLNHASLLDGGWLCRGEMVRYPHNDLVALEAAMAQQTGRRLVATDGVFSMDGDVAPLAELAAVCARRGGHLMVDDAHGLGVLGPGGAGSVRAAGLDERQVPVYMGTLGKALGTFGAFVAGSEPLIEFLIQRARTYIYTTAPPPPLAAAARAALRLAREEEWRRERLARLIARFRSGAGELGLPLMDSDTPIQPVIVGDADRAMALSRDLLDEGFVVTAIRPPTVPAGTSRLRITLSAAHSEEDIDGLLDAMARRCRGLENDVVTAGSSCP